jgi:hypothetical protein
LKAAGNFMEEICEKLCAQAALGNQFYGYRQPWEIVLLMNQWLSEKNFIIRKCLREAALKQIFKYKGTTK